MKTIESERSELSHRDIARMLGVSHAYVGQVERRALIKMRNACLDAGYTSEDFREILTVMSNRRE